VARTWFVINPLTQAVQLSRYAPHGVASGASIPDVALLSQDAEQKPVLLMVIEFKDTSMSPIEQLGQAVVECTNGLISQIHRGISYEQAIELFISTNGHLFQFGCVTLLEPCYPHATLSPVFDILDVIHS
jgi:hypothetical protein